MILPNVCVCACTYDLNWSAFSVLKIWTKVAIVIRYRPKRNLSDLLSICMYICRTRLQRAFVGNNCSSTIRRVSVHAHVHSLSEWICPRSVKLARISPIALGNSIRCFHGKSRVSRNSWKSVSFHARGNYVFRDGKYVRALDRHVSVSTFTIHFRTELLRLHWEIFATSLKTSDTHCENRRKNSSN